jgi:hypothetical protein
MTARTLARTTALVIAAALTGAASPPQFAVVAYDAPALRPVVAPASPPAATVSGFTPAPVPDLDREFGSNRSTGPATVELKPSIFHAPQTFMGDGYTPNSTVVQSDQSRHIGPAGGLNLNVPLN